MHQGIAFYPITIHEFLCVSQEYNLIDIFKDHRSLAQWLMPSIPAWRKLRLENVYLYWNQLVHPLGEGRKKERRGRRKWQHDPNWSSTFFIFLGWYFSYLMGKKALCGLRSGGWRAGVRPPYPRCGSLGWTPLDRLITFLFSWTCFVKLLCC